METIDLSSAKETTCPCGRIITQEEYDALISELAQEQEPELPNQLSEVLEKIRRLEFNMMILVGLIMVVFILCQSS
ncbi:MAG: hypothetical protein P8168_06985 [Deltaproteobacteria bacterium]|jgi:hypothetical protein